MSLIWADDDQREAGGDAAPGEWRDGVYIPARQPSARRTHATLIHDFVRTLLDLRTEQLVGR